MRSLEEICREGDPSYPWPQHPGAMDVSDNDLGEEVFSDERDLLSELRNGVIEYDYERTPEEEFRYTLLMANTPQHDCMWTGWCPHSMVRGSGDRHSCVWTGRCPHSVTRVNKDGHVCCLTGRCCDNSKADENGSLMLTRPALVLGTNFEESRGGHYMMGSVLWRTEEKQLCKLLRKKNNHRRNCKCRKL